MLGVKLCSEFDLCRYKTVREGEGTLYKRP